MSQFPTSKALANWAGICPGNNRSAGKTKSTRIKKGNRFLITALVFLFLKYADIGKAIRRSAENRLGALLVGTDVNRVYAICFGIGTACVGAAGALLVPLMPIAPHAGPPFTMISFIIVILGGMGSLMGAMVGGLIVGVAESVATIFLPSSLKQIVSFSLMVLILLFRPKGLFGR